MRHLLFQLGAALLLTLLPGAAPADAQSAPSILFVGNSFTFGSGSAVRFYRADTVTDLNNEGIGGVPALFKSFADQAGLSYDVYLETRGGSGLDFHLENKLGVIGQRQRRTEFNHDGIADKLVDAATFGQQRRAGTFEVGIQHLDDFSCV